MLGVDDVDFPEIGGQILAGAEIIDHLADRPMLGHRDQVALHQPAGRFLRIGERFLDRRAVVGIERAENGALVVLLHVLDDRDRVVGLELAGDLGDLMRLERVDQFLADMLVHLGEHVAVEHVGERRGERAAVVGIEQFEQIGDVGRVERLDQGAGAVGVARLDPRHHRADEFGLQPVVLVEPVACAAMCLGGRGFGGRFEFAFAHRPSPPVPLPRALLDRGDEVGPAFSGSAPANLGEPGLAHGAAQS